MYLSVTLWGTCLCGWMGTTGFMLVQAFTPSTPDHPMALRSLASTSQSSVSSLNIPTTTSTSSTTQLWSQKNNPSTTPTKPSAISFVEDLVAKLPTEGGGKWLLQNSSPKWRAAIYEAVGAPEAADEGIVAKALTDAMRKRENQFAILLGEAEDFVLEFPTDPVDYDDGRSWVECRLREKEGPELLVVMGVALQERGSADAGVDGDAEPTKEWMVADLKWQDFRDKFYPGVSGREWLRAF